MPRGTDALGPARGRCASCELRRNRPIASVLPGAAYDSVVRSLVLRAKSGGRREILSALGDRLAAGIAARAFARDCDAIVPVPSHPWTALRRGFNPADEIARSIARRVGLPVLSRLRRRLVRPASAKSLDARGRRLALRDAFRLAGSVEGRRIVLVDDVMTTGATAEACARTLLEGGAREIRLAVWARTLTN